MHTYIYTRTTQRERHSCVCVCVHKHTHMHIHTHVQHREKRSFFWKRSTRLLFRRTKNLEWVHTYKMSRKWSKWSKRYLGTHLFMSVYVCLSHLLKVVRYESVGHACNQPVLSPLSCSDLTILLQWFDHCVAVIWPLCCSDLTIAQPHKKKHVTLSCTYIYIQTLTCAQIWPQNRRHMIYVARFITFIQMLPAHIHTSIHICTFIRTHILTSTQIQRKAPSSSLGAFRNTVEDPHQNLMDKLLPSRVSSGHSTDPKRYVY